MNKARRSRNTWSKRIPALAVLLVSAMLCVLAVVYRGVEVTQVSVDDGGIWVTNQDRKLLGHLNYDALMLDGTVSVKSASFDIGQEGGSGGGRLIATGTPEQVASVKKSYTGQFLKPLLKR